MSDTPTALPLEHRVILITGASRGIGRAVALAAAKQGAELIITGRTMGALEELDDEISAVGANATIVELDQTDIEAMPRLAAAIAGRWGRLDGFVANAGQLGQMAPLAHIDADIFERTITVNLTSIWHQIAAFDGLLRQSDSGRAVLVSCDSADTSPAYWGAYAVSKAGLDRLASVWAAETEQTNLKINLINPGIVGTALRASAFPGEDKTTIATPDAIAEAFIPLLAADCPYHGEMLHAYDLLKS